MIFTDGVFFPFFAVTLVVYWLIRRNTERKLWLLLCSAAFYAFWDWRFLFLILFVVVNTYVTGLAVAHASEGRQRKQILTVGIGLSLVVLGFFKYFNFFAESLEGLLAHLHTSASVSTLRILLPVGISFYTFHSLSYMIDVYRGKTPATRSFLDIALYILFFPQLVAGPILRSSNFLPQLSEDKQFGAVDWRGALILFLVGFFKKTCIADSLAPLVDAVFRNPAHYGAGDAVVAVLSYTVQIYCDFSGYTDMAIAIAAMLGYRLPLNFAHPYLAGNPTDFWRRWHISLSSWLRDYLYIPLGGSRHGAIATGRNLMVTMLLGGLWHGASWTFVFWGGLHGVGLVTHRTYTALAERRSWLVFLFPPPIAIPLTFLGVSFAWIFFRAATFKDAERILMAFTHPSMPTLIPAQWFGLLIFALILVHIATYRANFRAIVDATQDWVFALTYGAAVAAILPLVNVNVVPFIYFQF